MTDNNGVPNVHYDYSMISVYSPGFIIKDDPEIQPPKEITKVALTVTGYKLGAKTQNAKINVDCEGVVIAAVEFVVLVDSNNDGIPESTVTAEHFEAGKQYAVSFTLKAEDGYDISTLSMTDVTYNDMNVIGSYDVDNDSYSGFAMLSPFDTCTVSFNVAGGKGKMNDVVVEKGDYILPENEFTAPEGKAFKTWSVNGKELAPGSTITVVENTTVTVVWEDIPSDHICKLEQVQKVAPTCTEDGREAYFRCEDCGKFYEDEDGKNVIEELFAWGKLEKLGHSDEDRDGKCDACGFLLTEFVEPEISDEPTDTDSDEPTDTDTSTDSEKSEGTDPSVGETSSASSDEGGMQWLWIALSLVLVLGVAASIVIIRKRAST